MKKIIAAILSIILVTMCSFSAYAYDNTSINPSESAQYIETGSEDEISPVEYRPYIIDRQTGKVYYFNENAFQLSDCQLAENGDLVSVYTGSINVPYADLSMSDSDNDPTYSVTATIVLRYKKGSDGRGYNAYVASGGSVSCSIDDPQVGIAGGTLSIYSTGVYEYNQISNFNIGAGVTYLSKTVNFTTYISEVDIFSQVGSSATIDLIRAKSGSTWSFTVRVDKLTSSAEP